MAILLVAWCISRFAKYSASPGSLYTYAAMILPPWLGAVAAWSLLLAYVATGSSVIGGFYHYANFLFVDVLGHGFSGAALALIVTGVSAWIAWRDIKISARLMLWIEAISLLVIVVVVVLVLARHGLHVDPGQSHLTAMTGGGLRLGLVLALFSFVGFESATTLGAEARDPLKTIPRVVIESAIIAGLFFIVSAYSEVLGFHVAGQDLGTSQAPMRVLAGVAHVPTLGILIDVGAAVSLFAGTLGCITAAARVLLLMAHNDLVHGTFRRTHARNETPTFAILATAIAAVLPVAVLAYGGSSGLDVYGWMGSLATYGFIVTYALVCAAFYRHALCAGRKSLPCSRGALRKAAVHLPRLFERGPVVVFLANSKRDQGLRRGNAKAGRMLGTAASGQILFWEGLFQYLDPDRNSAYRNRYKCLMATIKRLCFPSSRECRKFLQNIEGLEWQQTGGCSLI
jgi:amino acid transporter